MLLEIDGELNLGLYRSVCMTELRRSSSNSGSQFQSFSRRQVLCRRGALRPPTRFTPPRAPRGEGITEDCASTYTPIPPTLTQSLTDTHAHTHTRTHTRTQTHTHTHTHTIFESTTRCKRNNKKQRLAEAGSDLLGLLLDSRPHPHSCVPSFELGLQVIIAFSAGVLSRVRSTVAS